MAKVKIGNIHIKNPKDSFSATIKLDIVLDVLNEFEEGKVSRT